MVRSFLIKLMMLAVVLLLIAQVGWLPSDQPLIEVVEPSSQNIQSGVIDQPGLARSFDLVDLNAGTLDELIMLPGIGKILAQRIIHYRTTIGRFQSIEDLMAIKGIGTKRLARLRPFLTTRL